MTAFDFHKFTDTLIAINTVTSNAKQEIAVASEMYSDMCDEVEQSIVDSRKYFALEAEKSKTLRNSQYDLMIKKCNEYADYIKGLNEDARVRSKAYQKVVVESEKTTIQQPQYLIETIDQCQVRLHEASEEAKVAYERIVSNSGIGRIIDSVSGDFAKSCIALINAYKISKELLTRAESIASDAKEDGAKSDDEIVEKKILEAAKEADLLFEQIETKENEATALCLNKLSEELESIIPKNIIANIRELSPLVRPHEGNTPQGQCQFLWLGKYEYAIKDYPFTDKTMGIENELVNHFGDWYNNGVIVAPAIINRAIASSAIVCGEATVSCEVLNWLITSELETNQAPTQKFCFINPSGNREIFAPFLAAIKECHNVFGKSILTDEEEVSEALENAVRIINERGQSILVGYEDIYEFNYNEATANQPLITICMAAALESLSKKDRNNIKSIIRNGSCCGVNLLWAIDVDEIEVNEISDFLKDCNEALVMWPKDAELYFDLNNEISVAYEQTERNRIAVDLAIAQEEVEKQLSQSIELEAVLPHTAWHKGSSLKGLSIPMGKAPDGKNIALEFGPEVSNGISHFGLMIGATGSGKSSLLHSIIISSLLKYGPDELQLYLLDFKSGVEFDIYSKFRIPQIKLLALDAMQAFGLSIFIELKKKMEERNRLFRNEGVQNIEDYRKLTGNSMPRILVLMDEFQALFNEDHDRRIARESAVLLSDFISLARNCGIHFLLSTQTFSRLRLGNFSISQSTIDEMHVRIGLQCSPSEAEKLFGDIYGKKAYELMGAQKGSGVLTENDLKLPPEVFRSVFCEKNKRMHFLEEVQEYYSAINISNEMIVFRSETVPDIHYGIDRFKELAVGVSGEVPIFLGEPIRIGNPVIVRVGRRRKSTLLVVGADDRMLDSIIGNYLLSAFMFGSSNKSSAQSISVLSHPIVYLCDGRSMIGEPAGEVVSRVSVGRYENMKVASTNSGVLQCIDELYQIMLDRQNVVNESLDIVHLIINEYQWIDAFLAIYDRRDKQYDSEAKSPIKNDDPNAELDAILNSLAASSSNSNVSRLEKIEQLITRGYAYGINVVISTTDYSSLRERLYDLVPNMQNKVIFALGGEDAERLVHGSLGQMETMRSNMALFSDGRNAPELFKPYRVSAI